jgi:hypothetical protein
VAASRNGFFIGEVSARVGSWSGTSIRAEAGIGDRMLTNSHCSTSRGSGLAVAPGRGAAESLDLGQDLARGPVVDAGIIGRSSVTAVLELVERRRVGRAIEKCAGWRGKSAAP